MKTFTSEFCFRSHVIVEYWNPFNSVLDNSEWFFTVQFEHMTPGTVWLSPPAFYYACVVVWPAWHFWRCTMQCCVTCHSKVQDGLLGRPAVVFCKYSLKTPAKSTSDFKKDKIIIRSNNRMHAPKQCMCQSSPVFRWARTVCNYDNHRHHN